MAKLYRFLKSFVYEQDGQKVYVRKFKKNDEDLYVLDKKGLKQDNILELSGEALKVGKKCKAIEEIEE